MFSTSKGAAQLALAVVIALIIFKGTVAWFSGSISITAQAVDSFLDLFAISVAGFAVVVSNRPADEEHPFGHGKVEGLAAVIQSGLIFAAGGGIIYSAIRRMVDGTALELTEAGMAVMFVSAAASFFLSRHLRRVARDTGSLALEASAKNISADVWSAAGVLVALVIIRFTGIDIIDPIVALLVSVFILKAAYDVLKQSFGELVDVRLPAEEESAIRSAFDEHSHEVVGYHQVRTRRSGGQRFIDLHLLMPKESSLEEAHRMCDHLEEDIRSKFPNSSVTIHVEPCDEECNECSVIRCGSRRE